MDPNQISGHSFEKYNGNPAQINSSYVAQYMAKVYGWMFLGLSITAIIAFLTASSATAVNFLFGNRMVFFGLFIAQIFLVGYLVMRIQKMSAATATAVFLGYSVLTGITFFRTDPCLYDGFACSGIRYHRRHFRDYVCSRLFHQAGPYLFR